MTAGQLELSWSNKDMRLLTHGGDAYEWVDPADWRVAEVRLLEQTEQIGTPDAGNLLIHGDALHALTALTKVPEMAERYVGKVKLCYIDPPFNTGQAFANYDDAVEHSVWLTMLRDRLTQIHKLLADDGSVWVHLDDAEQHRGRCVLDEVFGAESFVTTIVWQKRTSRDNRAAFSSAHDYIHVYSPAGAAAWKGVRRRLPDDGAYANPDIDPRGPWRSIPMSAQAGRATASQFYTITTPTGVEHEPPAGRAWTYTEQRFNELVDANLVYWPSSGAGKPRLKRFEHESRGLVPFTLWPSGEVGENSDAKREAQSLFPGVSPFATPKPEGLLERIIHIATDPSDLVLDCFAGSGTTAAVAHKMGRRWVTVELSADNIATYVRPRFEKVVDGTDSGGITADAGWAGGGGFAIARVNPSMFEQEDGAVFLADWAVGGALAEAVCAQLGYAHSQDGSFCGSKGRSRLAVIDGMLTTGVADHLVGLLEDTQTLMVVAQALEPGVEEHVRGLRRGSRARKMPRDLARVGLRPPTLIRLPASEDTTS